MKTIVAALDLVVQGLVELRRGHRLGGHPEVVEIGETHAHLRGLRVGGDMDVERDLAPRAEHRAGHFARLVLLELVHRRQPQFLENPVERADLARAHDFHRGAFLGGDIGVEIEHHFARGGRELVRAQLVLVLDIGQQQSIAGNLEAQLRLRLEEGEVRGQLAEVLVEGLQGRVELRLVDVLALRPGLFRLAEAGLATLRFLFEIVEQAHAGLILPDFP